MRTTLAPTSAAPNMPPAGWPNDAPEHVRNREFSLIPTDAEPYINAATMNQEYRISGMEVIASCSDDAGRGGVAIVRRVNDDADRSKYGVIAFGNDGGPDGGNPKFDFSRVLPLIEDGPAVPISRLMNRQEAAVADGEIWLSKQAGGSLPYTRDTMPSCIVIDPGPRIVHKTIWARERYPF